LTFCLQFFTKAQNYLGEETLFGGVEADFTESNFLGVGLTALLELKDGLLIFEKFRRSKNFY
jgi:hypothetical protein